MAFLVAVSPAASALAERPSLPGVQGCTVRMDERSTRETGLNTPGVRPCSYEHADVLKTTDVDPEAHASAMQTYECNGH